MSDDIEYYQEKQKRLLKLREKPENFEAAVQHYTTNPVDFINDWMLTVDPRRDPSVMPFRMWPRQEEFVNWAYDLWLKREDGLCEKSRDSGATWLACAISVWLWIFHPNQVIAFGSRKEDLVDKRGDPDCIFEKIRFILKNLPVEFLPADFKWTTHDNHLRIVNPSNETVIKGESGDNIGRGGRSSIYWKDESAFYERSELIEASLSQNSDCKVDISTPNGAGNVFFRKRFGGAIKVFRFHWKQDPRKDEDWYQKQKTLLDPIVVAQEIDIDYNASVQNAFIDAEHVDAAVEVRKTDIECDYAPLLLGVDVARFGDDKTVICVRQGRVVHAFYEFEKMDTMQTVGMVKQFVDYSDVKISAIYVDVIGVGAGVYDRLAEHYDERVIPVNVAESSIYPQYRNKRTEIWGLMREWLKDAPVSIPNNERLRTDLLGLQYDFNSNGQVELESKKDAKKRGVKSPDLGDALALTFAYPVPSFNDEHYEETIESQGRSSVTGY